MKPLPCDCAYRDQSLDTRAKCARKNRSTCPHDCFLHHLSSAGHCDRWKRVVSKLEAMIGLLQEIYCKHLNLCNLLKSNYIILVWWLFMCILIDCFKALFVHNWCCTVFQACARDSVHCPWFKIPSHIWLAQNYDHTSIQAFPQFRN